MTVCVPETDLCLRKSTNNMLRHVLYIYTVLVSRLPCLKHRFEYVVPILLSVHTLKGQSANPTSIFGLIYIQILNELYTLIDS